MHPIARPELLDADRVTSDNREELDASQHRARADRLQDALKDTCAYATELWQQLDATRRYLWESLPSDPRAPGPSPHAGARPTGPGDDEGWTRWMDTYSAVTSALAGPKGDSGFGRSEARAAARDRRTAPNLAVMARHTQPAGDARRPHEAPPAPVRRTLQRADVLKAVGYAALVVLALRGLRPQEELLREATAATVAARRRR